MHEFVAAVVGSKRCPVHLEKQGRPQIRLLCLAIRVVAVALGLVGALSPVARAQERNPNDLRVQGFIPNGPRTTLTDSPGTLQIILSNPDTVDKQARVAVFFTSQPNVQYARDAWVPAQSIITTWLPIGPAPPATATTSRQIEILLFDRTGGRERLILPPGEERVRTRLVIYRKRELTTALMVDWTTDPVTGESSQPRADSALSFIRLVRHATKLSDYISLVPRGQLPTTAETFQGIDVLVLAGNRLGDDPPGRAAVRQWVQQGGTLWVMLDHTDPAVISPILGDDAPLAVVDRLGLTTLHLWRATEDPAQADTREFEQPVDLVRVIPSKADRVHFVANGWPAAFTRQLGRGKILFTTLGDRAWWRLPAGRDIRQFGGQPSATPSLPVAIPAITELAYELHATPVTNPLSPDALKPVLTEDIGYTIIGRGAAAAILGGFVLLILGVGLALRRSRRPELVGWLVPGLAVLSAGVLIVLGERSRRTVPPTVGVVALVDPIPSTGEAAVNGLYAAFHPSSGPVALGTHQGAILDLDMEGLGGQLRRRVQTDTDVWAWDGLELPAGVRTGPFQATMKTGRIAAVARFGPEGVEGRLENGGFTGPSDAIILPRTREALGRETPIREPLPARFGPEGTFTAVGSDVLPPGNYIAGAVLDDRQQRRQGLYRQLLSGLLPQHMEGRDMLFTWASMAELPFPPPEGARVLGNALLAVPVEFERPAPGSRVTVPRGFLVMRRMLDDVRSMAMPTNGIDPIEMRLRFQLPPTVLPMQVERVTIHARIQSPSRKFTMTGRADGKPVPLFEGTGTLDAVRIEVTDPRVLQPDDRGGVTVYVAFGASTDQVNTLKWNIESLSLEVVGTTGEPK